MSILHGIHTFSSGIVLTYKQFKKIFSACEKTGCTKDTSDIWKGKVRLYCCAYQEQGIKVFLHGRPGKLYRLRVQIECQRRFKIVGKRRINFVVFRRGGCVTGIKRFPAEKEYSRFAAFGA